jgi:hypothetical protein
MVVQLTTNIYDRIIDSPISIIEIKFFKMTYISIDRMNSRVL